MRKQGKRNPNPENAVRGPVVETRRVQDASTEGNTEWTERQMVQHGSEPLAGEFGLLKSEIQNERNTNKSFREDVYVDVDDLHTLPAQEHKGLDELGGENVLISKSLVDISTSMPAEERGNLIINDKVVARDRYHASKEKVTVEAWEPRTIVIKGDADAGGVDTTVTKQVVAGATAWPTPGANTMVLQREQIGYDKYVQVKKESNSTPGALSTRNSFGMLGALTLTTEQKVENSYSMPAPTTNVVAQTLKQLDGLKSLYSKTVLVGGWPTLVSYEEEPMTGKKVTVTRTVLDADPGLSTDATPRFVTDVEHTGSIRWAKTVREIHSSILTDTFLEYHTVEYHFPVYFDRTSPFGIIGDDPRPKKSGSHTLKIPCKFEITYHTAPVGLVEVFQFKTVDWDFTFNVLGTTNTRFTYENVIANAHTFAVGGLQLPASSPTSSELWTMMTDRTEVTIADDCDRWKFNLWKRVKVIMKIPDRKLTLI